MFGQKFPRTGSICNFPFINIIPFQTSQITEKHETTPLTEKSKVFRWSTNKHNLYRMTNFSFLNLLAVDQSKGRCYVIVANVAAQKSSGFS